MIMILPVLIVVGAAVELVFNQTLSFANAIRIFRVTSARNSLVSNLNTYSSFPATVRSSVDPSLGPAVNPELQGCLFGNGATPCVSGVRKPLTLYAPVSASAVPTGPSLQIIAGPSSPNGGVGTLPAVYDLTGKLCPNTNTPTSQCPLEAFASFVPTCPSGQATCSVADSITISFIVTTPSKPSLIQNISLQTISKTASPLSVKSILPQPLTAAQFNVSVINLLPVMGTAPITGASSSSGITLADVEAAVRAGGITDPTAVLTIAQTFINANIYSNLSYVTAVTQASFYRSLSTTIFANMIECLGADNITNTTNAVFLTKVGVTDPNWMNFVLASGVTDLYYTNMEFGQYQHYFTSPQQFAAAVNTAIAAGLPNNPASLAIAATGSTNVTQDQQMYAAVSGIPDPNLAAGFIMGGNTSPTQIAAILPATVGLNSLIGGAIAQLGITAPTLAQTLNSIVTSGTNPAVSNPYIEAYIILQAGGNVATAQSLMNSWQGEVMPTGSGSLTTTTTATTGTSGTSSTSGSTTTTTSSTTLASTQQSGVTGTISSCQSCAPLPF